jgi:hypothetical protein
MYVSAVMISSLAYVLTLCVVCAVKIAEFNVPEMTACEPYMSMFPTGQHFLTKGLVDRVIGLYKQHGNNIKVYDTLKTLQDQLVENYKKLRKVEFRSLQEAVVARAHKDNEAVDSSMYVSSSSSSNSSSASALISQHAEPAVPGSLPAWDYDFATVDPDPDPDVIEISDDEPASAASRKRSRKDAVADAGEGPPLKRRTK